MAFAHTVLVRDIQEVLHVTFCLSSNFYLSSKVLNENQSSERKVCPESIFSLSLSYLDTVSCIINMCVHICVYMYRYKGSGTNDHQLPVYPKVSRC